MGIGQNWQGAAYWSDRDWDQGLWLVKIVVGHLLSSSEALGLQQLRGWDGIQTLALLTFDLEVWRLPWSAFKKGWPHDSQLLWNRTTSCNKIYGNWMIRCVRPRTAIVWNPTHVWWLAANTNTRQRWWIKTCVSDLQSTVHSTMTVQTLLLTVFHH